MTGSKVRWSFDNRLESVTGDQIIHGWIYEFEVLGTCAGDPRPIFEWNDGIYDYTNHGFQMADVDGDGRADLIVTRAEFGRADAQYTLASDAGYSPFNLIFEWNDGIYDYSNRGFQMADVNGDDRADFVDTRAEPGRAEAHYTVATDAGYGPFKQIFEWNGEDFSNRRFMLADVNADRRADLIVTRAEAGTAEALYALANDEGYAPLQPSSRGPMASTTATAAS